MIYIVRGNDFNIKVALAKKVDDTTVPYELTNVTRLRLALVGHGMHVFAEDVEVSPLSSNTVVGMIPGRALLLGTYGLEITFRDNGKDKRFFVDNMFEAVNELIDDSDDEAEGEGGGIEVTITIQPEDIDFAGETGTAAGFGDVTATIDSGIGTPSVEVTASGPDTAKNFAFSFHNLKGVKGDKGDKGNTGATGAAGAAGKSAYQVWLDEGNEGSEQDFLDSLVGPQGPKGETGATGATGPQGAKGDTGATGATGPQGPSGPSGAPGSYVSYVEQTERAGSGARQDILMQMSDGNLYEFHVYNGAQGEKGDTGATGAQGPKGDTGATGATGPAGAAGGFGTPTASVDNNAGTPSVEISASGPDTAKVFNFAFHNLKGAKGDTGATGATGSQGPQGETGPQGPAGENAVGFESVSTPSTPDGTAQITLTNGDIITLDLNHNHPQYCSKSAGTSQPVGGFLPDVVYNLGTLTGAVTFALAAAVSGNVNHYFWMFETGSTAPTVTWPSGLTWADGTGPTVTASKHYEISVLDGIATYLEV